MSWPPVARTLDRVTMIACAIAALALRVVPGYHRIFQGARVVFASNDPWIHMRNVDNVAAHWPFPVWFDPYRLAPGGQFAEAPLMDVVIAGIARMTALPLDVVGAWFPAVAGALIPIPVFLLTRRLFGRGEAAIAALLIAILPGQLLQRSLLGFTDHHVVEALLTATVLLCLARAVESRRMIESLAAGVFLGLYLLAWSSGAFLVAIVTAWAAVEAARGVRITRVVAPAFVIALLMAAPAAMHLTRPMALTIPALAGGLAAICAIEFLPRKMGVIVVAVAAVAAILLLPALRTAAFRVLPSGGSASVGEVQPLLFAGGRFSPGRLWSELTTTSILAAIGFVIVARRVWRAASPSQELLLVFSAAVIAATFAQIRFAYYLAIAAAVLSGVAVMPLLWRGLHRAVAAIAVAAIVIYPNVFPALRVAAAPNGGPDAAWLEALDWMRVHTPEPYGSADEYFAWHGSAADSPEAHYSVMVWWDYAWWVSRIARRPPATNPTQVAVKEAGRFYTSTDEAQALAFLRERHARYVIADRSMPMSVVNAGQPEASQLELMARWAERDPATYYELYSERGQPVFLYYPEYYQTMAIRLFAYGGGTYTPSNTTWAIAANARKEIVDSKMFATYEEGAAFVRANGPAWRLAGRHPLLSAVPIAPVTSLVRDFASAQGVDGPIGRIPEVSVYRLTVESAPQP